MVDFALPQGNGWLPIWQLVVASTAVFNSVQNFMTLKLTRRLYANSPSVVTPLQARTFGIWTLTAAVVRAYAAYHINEKAIYDITLFTYLIAFCHFFSELLIFRTAKFNVPFAFPAFVSVFSMLWMFTQYDNYIKST